MKNKKEVKNKEPEFDHESMRGMIVALHRKSLPPFMNNNISHFAPQSKGRSMKNFPEETDRSIEEASKGNPARPKSHMDTIVKASRDAAKRAPGSTPSWLTKAMNMKKTEAEHSVKYAHDKEDGSGRTTIGVHKVKASDFKTAQKLTKQHLEKAGKKNISVSEEVEQIDELERKTIEKYHDARWWQRRQLKRKHSSIYGTDPKAQEKIDKIEKGLALAHKKMYKEEEEEIEEAKMNTPQKDAVKKAIDLRGKIGMKTSTSDAKKIIKFVKNEELELDEGRGRPAKVGSAAWHRQQTAAKSGDGGEQEADKNIVNQMRKKPVGDHHSLVFNNGEKKQVHVQHVNKALSMLANTAKPIDREKLQNSFSHSYDRFMATIKSRKPVEDAARPKVSLGKMKAEAVDPSTTPAGTGHIVIQKRRIGGVLKLVKAGTTHSHRDIVDAKTEAVTYYDPAKSEEAEEKREGQGAPKGSSHDMTKDSSDRMQAMSPQAFKQKFKLPPSLGNIAAGGEDATYAKGKYSVAEEKILNNLYDKLSEENRAIFDELMQTEEGVNKLLQFAEKQG